MPWLLQEMRESHISAVVYLRPEHLGGSSTHPYCQVSGNFQNLYQNQSWVRLGHHLKLFCTNPIRFAGRYLSYLR